MAEKDKRASMLSRLFSSTTAKTRLLACPFLHAEDISLLYQAEAQVIDLICHWELANIV